MDGMSHQSAFCSCVHAEQRAYPIKWVALSILTMLTIHRAVVDLLLCKNV